MGLPAGAPVLRPCLLGQGSRGLRGNRSPRPGDGLRANHGRGRATAGGHGSLGGRVADLAAHGPQLQPPRRAIDWIQSRFRAGRPATLYFDEVRCSTYVDDLNNVFARFLAGMEGGLFHAGGPRPITLYQIAQVVNRVGGYDPSLLKGCPRHEAGPMPPRAGNVSMCSQRLIRTMGAIPFHPWPVGEDLWPTDRSWHFTRPPGEEGSPGRIAQRLYRYPGPDGEREPDLSSSAVAG